MKVTVIADTHGLHDELHFGEGGDMIIHAGDVTEYGTEEEVMDFLKWFSKQPFTYKIFIAGNHDLFFEECTPARKRKLVPKEVIYLENSGTVIEGLKIWGSPVTPYFLGMAFNEREGKTIKKVWDKIPADTDILITHGPPKGILDGGIGCEELLKRVASVQPIYHCFGHAHGYNGSTSVHQTVFLNGAMVNTPDLLKDEVLRIIGTPLIVCYKPYTKEEIIFLSNLNRELKIAEQQIVDRATVLLQMAVQKLENKDDFTTDFEVEAEIEYYLRWKEDHVHSVWLPFDYNQMVVQQDYGMLLDNGRGSDWHRQGTMPVLDEPYCYLLHDLLDHQKIEFNIYNINMIWVDVKYTDQKKIQLSKDGSSKRLKRVKKRKWKEVKTNSTDSNNKP